MAAFVKWMAQNEGKLHPVEFAALVHQKFVYIHPFVGGRIEFRGAPKNGGYYTADGGVK